MSRFCYSVPPIICPHVPSYRQAASSRTRNMTMLWLSAVVSLRLSVVAACRRRRRRRLLPLRSALRRHLQLRRLLRRHGQQPRRLRLVLRLRPRHPPSVRLHLLRPPHRPQLRRPPRRRLRRRTPGGAALAAILGLQRELPPRRKLRRWRRHRPRLQHLPRRRSSSGRQPVPGQHQPRRSAGLVRVAQAFALQHNTRQKE
jgi:hypothetical protein